MLEKDGSTHVPKNSILSAAVKLRLKDHVTLMGFPAYKIGQTPYLAEGKIASLYTQKGVEKCEITAQIREGNSGGPVVDEALRLVGIAVEGAEKSGGNNAVVLASEIFDLLGASQSVVISKV